jgi:nucleoid-associated protein YgaU
MKNTRDGLSYGIRIHLIKWNQSKGEEGSTTQVTRPTPATGKQRAGFLSATAVSLLLSCAATSYAQSLGDFARQERERKQSLAQHAEHIYTNDDLKKPQILAPEDQARMLAARRCATTPAAESSANPVAAPSAELSFRAANDDSLRECSPRKLFASGVTASVRHLAPLSSERSPRIKGAAAASRDLAFVETRKKRSLHTNQQPNHSDHSASVPVAPGDSLWRIAARNLGSGTRWRELIVMNPEISNPNVIQVGEWIRLSAKDSQNARQVVIRAGDTLWHVAQTQFGDARSLSCIAHENPRLRAVDLIYPGQTLVLPDTCAVRPVVFKICLTTMCLSCTRRLCWIASKSGPV